MMDKQRDKMSHPPSLILPPFRRGKEMVGGWLYSIASAFIAIFIFIPSSAVAANDKNIGERTQAIASQLSCVVCSGQSVASSNAALAQDMRAFIATKLRAGKSRAEIKAFLRKRYGDKILMRPPVKPATYILWAAPLLALLAGTGIIYGFYRKGRQA